MFCLQNTKSSADRTKPGKMSLVSGSGVKDGGGPQLVQCFYFGFLRLKEAQEFVFTSFSTIICMQGFFEICFCDKI